MPISTLFSTLDESVTVGVEVSENAILILEITIVAHSGLTHDSLHPALRFEGALHLCYNHEKL
jgi:hypothetical protein